MKTVEVFVAGEPKGQPRPKAFSRFGHAAVYDPGTAEGWKLLVRSECDRVKPESRVEGPVSLVLVFFMARPKSHYRSNGDLKPTAPKYHTKKPDADNFAKAVMDAISNIGTWWADDDQVASLKVEKFYSNTVQGCLITMRELENVA